MTKCAVAILAFISLLGPQTDAIAQTTSDSAAVLLGRCRASFEAEHWVTATSSCRSAANKLGPMVLNAASVDDANYLATLESTALEREYLSFLKLGKNDQAHDWAGLAYARAAAVLKVLHDFPGQTEDHALAKHLFSVDMDIMRTVRHYFPDIDPRKESFPPSGWRGPD